jgi:hypothetical protein
VTVGELDLVLSHHDLRSAPNQWKHLRRRLGAGARTRSHGTPTTFPPGTRCNSTTKPVGVPPAGTGSTSTCTGTPCSWPATGSRSGAQPDTSSTWHSGNPISDHPHYYHSATLHPADGHFATTGQGIHLVRWR